MTLFAAEKIEIRFTVLGKPQPAGSKRAMPLYRKDGSLVMKGRRPIINVIDDNKHAAAWKKTVKAAAKAVYRDVLLTGPVEAEFWFYRVRPLEDFVGGDPSRGLRSAASDYPITRPDALKMARAIEDALTGLIWQDDSQIVDEHLHKRWGDRERVEVIVREL